MRAAIYARFSTELQSVASIEDQARLCRERATALGLSVVAIHSDCAISGATPVNRRPGASTCVAEALAGRFDALLVESLDRLSRNLVEQETVIRRLEHRGIRIIGVSDGYDFQGPGESCCAASADSSVKRTLTTCGRKRTAA